MLKGDDIPSLKRRGARGVEESQIHEAGEAGTEAGQKQNAEQRDYYLYLVSIL